MTILAQVNRAFEAKRKAQEDLMALYDAADGEKRSLTDEEKASEQRMIADIKAHAERETNLLKMKLQDEQADESRKLSDVPTQDKKGKQGTDDKKPSFETEFRQLINGERRSVTVGYEKRDLTAGTATDGAELVPTTLFNELHELVVENSPIMQVARVLRTAGGEQLTLPRVTSYSAASLVAEAGTIGESDPQFDTVQLDAYKYGFLVQISRELEQDAAFSASRFVVDQGAAALGRGVDTAFVTGTGSSQPQGVVNATTGLTTAAVAAVTFDELIEAQHSVLSPQRANAVWVFNDSTIEAIRKLKDGNSNYIWRPGGQAGAPDRLLGDPIFSDPNISGMAATNTFGLYGDMAGFYTRFAGGVEVERSEHFAFANDLVTYRFLVRVDSVIVDTTGIRKLVNAAV